MTLLRLEEPRALEQTIATIQKGGIVAFPTDTVYGIAASLTAADALHRIFTVKGRTAEKTLPILMSSGTTMKNLVRDPDPRLLALANQFWPGPLTVILPGLPDLPKEVLASDGTIGVRIPNHSVALTIAERCGGAIAVTSANPSGAAPALHAEDIPPELAAEIDIILDGGIARGGLASTVIRPAGDRIDILREGSVTREAIDTVWEAINNSGEF
jgi:L-threonylcarbamoyladenylate synthase